MLRKGKRVGRVRGIAKYLLFLTGVGGFQKSYVIFGSGMPKYLLFLTGVDGWSGKDQKHPYVII